MNDTKRNSWNEFIRALKANRHHWPYKDAAIAADRLIAAAPELLEACKYLAKEINLSKLNIKKDFSLINAHATALKAIYKAEGKEDEK